MQVIVNIAFLLFDFVKMFLSRCKENTRYQEGECVHAPGHNIVSKKLPGTSPRGSEASMGFDEVLTCISLNLCVFKCVYRTADLVSWKHLVPFLARLASSWSSCFVLESALFTIMPSESDTCYHRQGIIGCVSHLRHYW